jgi:hypothetical protein
VAEGCREPLAVWAPEGERGPQVLLDGHNRHRLCLRHQLAYTTVVIALDGREAAVNWVIDNQLGRRNLTPEQKSYLRGKCYNLEKRREGRPEKLRQSDEVSGETRALLAEEYGVGERTIRDDAQFAEAVDTLEEEVRQDIRKTVLKRKSREDKARITKRQAVKAGQAIKERRVEPLPFMRRADWKDHQVIEAIDLRLRSNDLRGGGCYVRKPSIRI